MMTKLSSFSLVPDSSSVSLTPSQSQLQSVTPWYTQWRWLEILATSWTNCSKNTAHINKTVSTTYCQIRNIQKIRSKLDIESTCTVVQALILSRLNYCNSMLQGSADYQLHKLQKIQNMACRVVCNLKKYDHVSNQHGNSSLAKNL